MSGRTFLQLAAALLAFVPTLALAAEPVKVSARIDKSEAQVAEPIRLVLEVAAPRGTRVELPKLPNRLGDFEVLTSERSNDIPAAADGQARRWVLAATLESIQTGDLTIPPLDVTYALESQTSDFQTLRSEPIAIRIQSVLENRADPTKFRDIKDVVDLPVPERHSYTWLGWTAAGLGVAIAFALLAVAVAKRRRGPSAAEWALAAIADLEQLKISNSGDAETAYNEVADIVREFFELEFSVPTLSRTTREFLAQAAKVVGLDKAARERLAALATIADEIKFACLGVGEPQVRQALNQAREFIAACEAQRRASQKEAA